MPKSFFSYSEFSSFNRNPEDYYKQYCEGISPELTPEAEKKIHLGVLIHSLLADPKFPFVKEMKEAGFSKRQTLNAIKAVNKIERLSETEVSLVAVKHDPPLHCVLDGLDRKNRLLDEHKTTDKMVRWNQSLVDKDKQLSFESYVFYQLYHKFLKELRLNRINTETGTVKKYLTVRGPADLKYIGYEIERVVGEIKANGWWNLRLSRAEFALRNQLALPV